MVIRNVACKSPIIGRNCGGLLSKALKRRCSANHHEQQNLPTMFRPNGAMETDF